MIRVEALERETHTAGVIAAVMRGAGAEVDIPTVDDERAAFDLALAADPDPNDSRQILRELGVA